MVSTGVRVIAPVKRITIPKKKMVIWAETRKIGFTVPYAPREIDHSGYAPTYQETDRPGRAPLVQRSAEPLNKMSFTLFLGKDPRATGVEANIRVLESLAKNQTRCMISGYGALEGGLWRITSMSFSSLLRNQYNAISRATVELEFTRAVDALVNVGPVSGGVKKPKTPPSKAKPKPAPPKARYYTMKKGDTLWELAVKYYGTGTKWKVIADANKIRNVRTIPIGKKLRIP